MHERSSGQSRASTRQEVCVNMRGPQMTEGSEGQIKAQRCTHPGAVLEDNGQVATAVHHSPVRMVSHPSQHAPTAQLLSEMESTAQKSCSKLTHVEQMQNMDLFDHTATCKGRLGAFAHQVQSRPQRFAGIHRQQGEDNVFPACAFLCQTSGQALAHHLSSQKFQPSGASRDGVAQVSNVSRNPGLLA